MNNVKRGFRGLALAIAVVFAVASAPTAAAAAATAAKTTKRQAEIKKQAESLRNQISEASAEEADLADRLDAAKARRAALDAEVAELNRQVAAVEADLASATSRLEEMSAELVRAQAKLESARVQLAEAKDVLRTRAVAAYVGQQPNLRAAAATVELRTDRDVAAYESYVGKIVGKQQELVEQFRLLKAEAIELQQSIERQRDQARVQRDVVASRLADLEGVKGRLDAKRNEIAAQENSQAHLLAEVRDRKADFAAELAQLQAESESISAFLRGAQSGQAIVISGNGRLSYPIPGARITSTFGPRVHPIYGDVRMHTGIDFAAGSGVPIRAAADGVVLSAGVRGGYGNTILLDHGGALATMYAHQSAFAVAAGARVAKGQVIGYVGSTGNSTGPHLHFEARVNGTPVNPMQFF